MLLETPKAHVCGIISATFAGIIPSQTSARAGLMTSISGVAWNGQNSDKTNPDKAYLPQRP